MGTSEASLFSEIKTGGNGDEVRKSNVEHKNVVSLVLYIQHYHERNLLSDRRKCEAILNVAWAELPDETRFPLPNKHNLSRSASEASVTYDIL